MQVSAHVFVQVQSRVVVYVRPVPVHMQMLKQPLCLFKATKERKKEKKFVYRVCQFK